METGMHRAWTQIVAVALAGIGLVLISGRISWAQFGTPTVFKMTIKELCFNTTGNGVFPANLCFVPGTQEFDLAAVGPNAVAGSLNFSVPAATYLQVRGTFSCTFGLQGTVTFAGQDFKTTAAGGTLASNDPLVLPAEGPYKLPGAACDFPNLGNVVNGVPEGHNVRASPDAPNNISLDLGGNVDLITNVTDGLFLLGGVLLPGNFSISIVSLP